MEVAILGIMKKLDFKHTNPNSEALCATGRREIREDGFSIAIRAICEAPAQIAV